MPVIDTDPFVHLHVASGHSMRHGASTPAALVSRAAELGQSALALTDRDSLGGAVRFLLACREAGIRPLLGVDLAVSPVIPAEPSRTRARRSPTRGGVEVDPRLPRAVLIARDARGWAALCRIVSAAYAQALPVVQAPNADQALPVVQAAGSRDHPCVTLDTISSVLSTHGLHGSLVALLGPESEVARSVLARRPDRAAAALRPWRELLGADLRIEVVSHRARDRALSASDLEGATARGLPLSTAAAARLLLFAREHQVGSVLANAVRHADPESARVVDLLDAVRRLVPLDSRHLDRANAEGHLKSAAAMGQIAHEICTAAGAHQPRAAAHALLADTLALAEQCVLDPGADVGLGELHVPELDVLLPSDVAGEASTRRHVTSAIHVAPALPVTPALHAHRRRDPALVTTEARHADHVLRSRCEQGLVRRGYDRGPLRAEARQRLDDELAVFATLGFAGYVLTVSEVVDLIVERGIRVAARGSGAGSLVAYLLGISGVDPLEHGLLMERFCSTLRHSLPDIDIDVESARRTEIYGAIIERFGTDRVACVAMYDTYRVRHAVRDVGAALGLPPGEVDAFAKAFPHVRARDARNALADLPELRHSGFGRLAAQGRLDGFLDLVESLDGLPRHIALHPCGVLLSDASLLDRTPVQPSALGFPMSPFDKDDVEELGFLKLDVLGIRMQSAMAHAINEIARVDGDAVVGEGGATLLADGRIDLDSLPRDDDATFELIRSTRTLGCFQIESPGQRELLGKFAPETFGDLIIDISLFRPGPVKSDMVTPFLRARQGWSMPAYLHDDLRDVLAETRGVVVFHEQVLHIVSITTGCSLAEADEVRRRMGSPDGQTAVRDWYYPQALARGYDLPTVEVFWDVLAAFASFGFCKAHAAAFALPTYQSAWLKAHHPAAFLAGVLTHDPGMYPKRLILDDARHAGVDVLALDVNHSRADYTVERLDDDGVSWQHPSGATSDSATDGVSRQHPVFRTDFREAQSVGTSGATGDSVTDGVSRQHPSDATGDSVTDGVSRQHPVRYGLRLSLAEVRGISDDEVARIVAGQPYASLADFWHRAGVSRPVVERLVLTGAFDALHGLTGATAATGRRGRVTRRDLLLSIADLDRWSRSASRAGSAGNSRQRTQLSLDLGDCPDEITVSGLPELTAHERVQAELTVLGLDVSSHVLDPHLPLLRALGSQAGAEQRGLRVVRACDLLRTRSRQQVLVAGVKVATQTPPVRSGRRVIFLTLDDATGPVDATFFDDAQGPYASTLFHSWLLLVRGEIRRTGPRGVSVRATGCWELPVVDALWRSEGMPAVRALLATPLATDDGKPESLRPRRVLVHPSGFRQSPYADLVPPGESVTSVAPLITPVTPATPATPRADSAEQTPDRKLWHSSPGSSGW